MTVQRAKRMSALPREFVRKRLVISVAVLVLATIVSTTFGLVASGGASATTHSATLASGRDQLSEGPGRTVESSRVVNAKGATSSVRAAAASSTDNLPADCIPKPSGPPGSHYQLGLVGTVDNGVVTAGPATIAHITAKFCGVVTVVPGKAPCGATGTVVIPQDGQVFGALTAQLTMIPGMAPRVPFTDHPGTITGGFACTTSSASGLAVNATATVSGSTGLYGLSCTIGPFSIPMSGVVSGPLNAASITLTGDHFSVPRVAPSATCPAAVASNLDAIAGLPIAPGGASARLPATTSIYQPAS